MSSGSFMSSLRFRNVFIVVSLILVGLYLFSSSSSPNMGTGRTAADVARELKVETAPDVKLSSEQHDTVKSVLGLFCGDATLDKLSRWADDAVFEDPITIAKGREQFEPQWYGLQTVFSRITPLSHKVTSGGNPITIDVSNQYVVKGINTEKTIDSVVRIFTRSDGKIERVEDRWNGELPSGAVSDAFRKLNAISVPKMVDIPKNAEEDAKRPKPDA